MNREILLRENEIADNLKSTSLSVRVYDTVTSTSDLVRQAAEEGAPEGLVIIAKNQSAGRGRIGKSFFSPTGGLYMSILLRPKITATELLTVTPLAAVSVSEAIEAVTGKRTEIKWVNDLFYCGKKVCGILTESPYDASTGGVKYTSVGIGINVVSPDNGYGELDSIAGALYTSGKEPGGIINRLAAEVADRFYGKYKAFDRDSIYDEYKNRLFLFGREVYTVKDGERQRVSVLDLTPDFGLVVRDGKGEVRILSSGEISIIPM